MVQMVFVHGVATRSGASYAREVKNRDKLFRDVLFENVPLTIHAPFWGDLVPPLGGKAFAGANGVGAFGGVLGGLGAEPASDGTGRAVADLARADSAAALDAIYATLLDQADQADREMTDDEVAAFKAVTRAIADGQKPALPETESDDGLVVAVRDHMPQTGSFGIASTIKDAVVALADRARNTVSTSLSDAFRDRLNPLVGRFLGDIFVYLRDGELRQKIRECVCQAIMAAHDEVRRSSQPLVLVGHSLGGVILYDLLSSSKDVGLPDDLRVNVLLTVGSQPGLFEEMGLFQYKNPNPGAATPGPDCVENWLNIFDPIDVFGFRTTSIFAKPEDFAFDSVTGLLSSHTTYFKRPQFYARSRSRLHELGII
jgi:hypothetical protein